MHNESDIPSRGGLPAQATVDAVARRRLLLKSLGKGSAIAAAATPLASFSAPLLVPTTDGTQCTISGFKSALASRAPVGSLPCGGHPPVHFVASGNPNGWPMFSLPLSGGRANLADLALSDLFPGSPGTLVLDILINEPNGVPALFVAAYFNALLTNSQGLPAPGGRVALPYSASEVVTQYNNGSPSVDAVLFYRLVLGAP